MNSKLITMGALALVFGALSVVAADFWLDRNIRTVVETVPADPAAQPTVRFGTIVVASEPLRYGTTIAPRMLREIPWPKDSVPEGAFASIEEVTGDGPRAALSMIEANEPVLSGKVTGPDGRPTLSNRLSIGKRAVTIPVDRVTGVGGFVVPGDRVDLVLTQQEAPARNGLDGAGPAAPLATAANMTDRSFVGEDGRQVTAQTVLENIKVLSIDQIADESQADPVLVASVTLELSAAQARTVTAAQRAGTLSLHLRKAGEGLQAPFGIDPSITASYENRQPTGLATITVRQGERSEIFTVRDERVGQ